MTFKGLYSPSVTYEINDVVLGDDGNAYRLQRPCQSGVPPIDTNYWTKMNPVLGQCAQLIVSYEKPVAVVEEAPKTRSRKGAKEG